MTKIQAHFRGHKVRKNIKNEDDNKDENEVVPAVASTNEEKMNEHAPSSAVAKKIDEWPKINNAQVEQTLKKVGEIDKREEKGLPVLGPYELENGAVYWGQWKYGRKGFFEFFKGCFFYGFFNFCLDVGWVVWKEREERKKLLIINGKKYK